MQWDWTGPSEQLSAGDETALPCHSTAGDSSCACSFAAEQVHQCLPHIGFKMSATISDDPEGDTKAGSPTTDKGLSNSLCCNCCASGHVVKRSTHVKR